MPSPSTRIAGLLASLAEAFEALQLRWYVFGAQASIVHGAARLTADVDVTVDIGRTTTKQLVSELGRRGFEPQFRDVAFLEVTRVIPLVHKLTKMPVDLVLAGPGLEDLFFQRVQRVKIGRKSFNVAAAEDIIVMKILSGRPKDIEDIESLLVARQGELNLSIIRDTLATAEALLDQSDLLPAFERLARLAPRTMRRKKAASTTKKTRPRTR